MQAFPRLHVPHPDRCIQWFTDHKNAVELKGILLLVSLKGVQTFLPFRIPEFHHMVEGATALPIVQYAVHCGDVTTQYMETLVRIDVPDA